MKTFRAKQVTRYYKQNTVEVARFGNATICVSSIGPSQSYFYRSNDEIISIPSFVGRTFRYRVLEVTAIIGPFVCFNGFEDFRDANILKTYASNLYPSREMEKELIHLEERYGLWFQEMPEEITHRQAMQNSLYKKLYGTDRPTVG